MKAGDLRLVGKANDGGTSTRRTMTAPDDRGAPAAHPADAILPLELIDVGFEANGETLLQDINLSFSGSAPSIILGPNGAGKTLLLRICHGLLRPTRGRVRWRDPELALRPDAQGMVFQKPVVLRRSVRANIRFALKVCGIDAAHQQARIDEALAASDLDQIADRRATHLSGGEQQRLALARCLAIRPRVLFLDEPTAHLDPAATHKVEGLIGLIRQSGTRVIMVTHDIGQAKRLGGEIIFMHRGTVLETGAAAEFLVQPDTREAAAYLAGELLW